MLRATEYADTKLKDRRLLEDSSDVNSPIVDGDLEQP
jgi:hypothetical protein